MSPASSRQQRLSKKSDFERVLSQGYRIRHGRLTAWLLAAPVLAASPLASPQPRLGCIVSRKYGNSVRRHQLKRRLRAAFHQAAPQLPPADIVVIVTPGKSQLPYDEIQRLFQRIAELPDSSGKTPAR